MKLRELGEEKLVEKILAALRGNWRCQPLPPGDDASCIRVGSVYILLKIDGYSFSSSRLPWMSLEDLGWKSVIATASDLIAKGGRPEAFLVSIGVDPERDESEVLELMHGAAQAAGRIGAWIAGGDTNASHGDEWIDVAGIGVAERPVGMAIGECDEIYTTVGRYGLTGLAFYLLSSGSWDEIKSYPEAYRATTKPLPRLEFLKLLEEVGECITWASDVSDGLIATLSRIPKLTGYNVYLESLPPLHPEALEFAREKALDESILVFRGGEEYEIVFSVKRACITEIEKSAYRLGLRVARIGMVGTSGCIRDTRTRFVELETKILIKEGLSAVYTRWDQFRGWS